MMKKIPLIIALFCILGGVGISILFGINEDIFKSRISAGLQQNVKLQQIVDPVQKASKMASEADKNWRYYQRFHFHATGIGAMMLGMLLLLARLRAPWKHKNIASYMVAIGGTLYPFLWLFSGIYGPEMGRNEAKEAFAFFGYMGGVFLLGGIYTTILTVKYELADHVQLESVRS